MKNNLKRIRKSLKLTLDALSELSGVSKSYIFNLEDQNGACPSIKNAYLIAASLGQSVYEIWPDETKVTEETITVRRVAR